MSCSSPCLTCVFSQKKVKTTLSVHSTQKTKKSENIPPLHAEGHVPMLTHSCCQEVEEVAAEVLAKWQHKQETVAHACWSVVQPFKSKQLASGAMYSRQQNILSHRASEVTDHWICQLIFSKVYEKTHRHTTRVWNEIAYVQGSLKEDILTNYHTV